MAPVPHRVHVHGHPGSSIADIEGEPDWGVGHEHRIGYKNRQDHRAGITHARDEDEDEPEVDREYQGLQARAQKGELTNFRQIVDEEKDYHLMSPEKYPIGWRYVLNCTEDWVKNVEDWPANIQKRRKQEEAEKEEDRKTDRGHSASSTDETRDEGKLEEEHEWKQRGGENKHHNAYAAAHELSQQQTDGDRKKEPSEYEKLLKKYTPQEIALLRSLQHERDYIANLQQDDGKRQSPQKHNKTEISIDEADQFSPDNWLPRSSDLIRLTGKHPLNAEPHLSHLFDAGLITPNELHYVRNHGAVPRLLRDIHQLEIEGGKIYISMDELKTRFDWINIPIALACDGNRRKELNMIKKSKGFNWGPAAVSCAFWKGPLLRDILHAAGVQNELPQDKRFWVNFEGADELSEGKYATSIPLQYAMDSTNDVILAYEMNNELLPPDHGYPVRLMIPGYVGGRCVKWLKKIWISENENDSYYHIWDNRVLPSFVTEKDGEFAETLFRHPDTACNEQNLNSVIVKPHNDEKIPLTEARKGKTYRVEGYAYDGGGHEVQRVEISLDDGETWLYCIRKFPGRPIRHGKRFWTWLHWHVEIELVQLLQAHSITVRCFNVFKNTQPQHPIWNSMGMMNNCWYVVRPAITQTEDSDIPSMHFRHPVEPGVGDRGWMKPSVENQISNAKQQAGAPQKPFTRQEVEKHDSEDNCWIVVDGKVYDATSVLAWHPGGKAAVLGHAGKVHQETSDEFASIHDGYAYQKLNECILGVVTDKAMNYIMKNAEAATAQQNSKGRQEDNHLALKKHRWVPCRLINRKAISQDTRTYTFHLPDNRTDLGLGTCQHIQLGFHLRDRMLIRSYTPTRPLLPSSGEEAPTNNKMRDGSGTFDLTVKVYFPDDKQPGGALSNILDCIPLGEDMEIRGPTGEIVYNGFGKFTIEGKEHTFERVSLVLGGSGLTPGYSLIARIMLTKGDNTRLRMIDANKSEGDMLLRDSLDRFEQMHQDQIKVTHVLSHPSEDWKGLKGHVNADIIKSYLFEPGEKTAVFLCGPPTMIQKAALPALKAWGYVEDENMFGF